jgi:hypothetical protein
MQALNEGLKLFQGLLQQVAKMLSAWKNKDWVFVLSVSTKSTTNFIIGIFEVSSLDK